MKDIEGNDEGGKQVPGAACQVEELLRVNELRETVPAASEGAPVQAKDMF
jgi:hypothetical protein